MDENTLLSVREVAAYLQLQASTVYSWAQDGKIPAIKIGRTWRFRWGDIDGWLRAEKAQSMDDDTLKSNELLDVKEVAEHLRLQASTVYSWAQDGRIPAFKVGGRWQFRRSDLDAWLARQAQPMEEPSPTGVFDDIAVGH